VLDISAAAIWRLEKIDTCGAGGGLQSLEFPSVYSKIWWQYYWVAVASFL